MKLGLVVVALSVGCGGDPVGHLADAPPADAPIVDALQLEGFDGPPACITGADCVAANPCAHGTIACTTGTPICVETPIADNSTCPTGTCSAGTCLPATAITTAGDLDLSTTPITPGRTCAESPRIAASAVTATTATLTAALDAGCLVAGDEVLVIDLQGTVATAAAVGQWEHATIATASGVDVTFASPLAHAYDASTDRIALVRVPNFGMLSIAAGVRLVGPAWDGSTGGVIAIRAASVMLDGTIDANGLGYRPGRWSEDANCTSSVTTEAGESIAPASQMTAANFGGAGGIGELANSSYNGNTPVQASSGHATAGQVGTNFGARTPGDVGAIYGTANASTLTMGSGSAGNLTCGNGATTPRLQASSNGSRGGGIVAIFGGTLTVGAGAIRANAVAASRDTAGSGGYIFVDVSGAVDLGATTTSAVGAIATGASPATTGVTNAGGDGYIAVRASSVAGTTTPQLATVP